MEEREKLELLRFAISNPENAAEALGELGQGFEHYVADLYEIGDMLEDEADTFRQPTEDDVELSWGDVI